MSNAMVSLHGVTRVTHNISNVTPDAENPAGRKYQVYRIEIECEDGSKHYLTCFSAGETLQPIEAAP